MELNKVPLNTKISQNENATNITTTETKNNYNIETFESINSQPNDTQKIKNKFDILIQLIKKNNSTSGIIKQKFNKWKNIAFPKYEGVQKHSKKILIKKKFNIRRSIENRDLQEKDKKKIKVIQRENPNLNEGKEKRKKIIKFIEDRITSYISRKDILKKYYYIWKSNAYDKEKIITNKITRKKIFKFKVEKNNNNIVEKEKEKEEKIKNIMKYKNKLRFYFKLWKNISKNKEIEVNKDEILINSNENENPTKKIKIIKQLEEPKELQNKRKIKLNKLITSNNTKKILRKYFKHWNIIIFNNYNINKSPENQLNKNKTQIEENIYEIKEPNNINKNNNNENENTNEYEKEEQIIVEIENPGKNIAEQIDINKNSIEEPIINNEESTNSKNEQPSTQMNDNIKQEDIKEIIIEQDNIKEELKEKQEEKEKKDNEIIPKTEKPEISNDEFILYKICHDQLMNNGSKKTIENENHNIKSNVIDNPEVKNKLVKIINNRNPLKEYFNKWKKLSKSKDKKDEDIMFEINKKTTIIINKQAIPDKNIIEQKEQKDPNIYNIKEEIKEVQPEIINNKDTNKKSKSKIVEIIKKRISSYLTSKQLLRKYYDRWLAKVPPGITKEQIVNKRIKKIVLSFKKKNKHTENDKETIDKKKFIWFS